MAKKYQAPRGTHDVVPGKAAAWRHLERTFADLAALYGYGEVRTPMFEDVELFVRSSGETSDVVTKQMYDFKDKGGRHVSLKPEGTAPAVRAYIEHNLGQPGHVTRLWYATPIFRYERPQLGRQRQAHQVGLELIGSSSPAADAEVIEMTVRFYEKLGVSGLRVMLNCIGRADTREKFGAAVLAHVKGWLASQDAEHQAKARKNPLRLLDTKDDELKEALRGAPSILDFLSNESRGHFALVQAHLGDAEIAFDVVPDIVRGLDYYTDTVFEIQSDALGSQNSLCGGGRYDWLVKELGGPDTPSVGVAMGVERALMVMEQQSAAVPAEDRPVFVVAATEGARMTVKEVARELRKNGVGAITDLDDKPLKGQMKQADRSGARFAVIIGDEEIEKDSVTLKDLEGGDQRNVARSALVEGLKQAR
ncbi:MAG: histidine--tRNA ligase [Fimbriimonadaceae bacterium]